MLILSGIYPRTLNGGLKEFPWKLFINHKGGSEVLVMVEKFCRKCLNQVIRANVSNKGMNMYI